MIILKSKNFAINCNKVLKITQNEKVVPAEYSFNWLGKPWFTTVKIKDEQTLYQLRVEYKDADNEFSAYTMSYALRDHAIVVKQVIKQDPEMAWLDKAAEEGLLGTEE